MMVMHLSENGCPGELSHRRMRPEKRACRDRRASWTAGWQGERWASIGAHARMASRQYEGVFASPEDVGRERMKWALGAGSGRARDDGTLWGGRKAQRAQGGNARSASRARLGRRAPAGISISWLLARLSGNAQSTGFQSFWTPVPHATTRRGAAASSPAHQHSPRGSCSSTTSLGSMQPGR